MAQMNRERSCTTCPFRGGFYLDWDRRQEIYTSTVLGDATFPCHHEIYDEEKSRHIARQCAGAVTLMLREDIGNQSMRIEQRIDNKPLEQQSMEVIPFPTWADWIDEEEYSE